MNSSLCNLRANAASSLWLGIPLLLLTLASLLATPEEGRTLLFLVIVWPSFSGLCRLASRLFKAPAAFLASTSCGNSSCIVFHRTVFTVQDLPLLQTKLHPWKTSNPKLNYRPSEPWIIAGEYIPHHLPTLWAPLPTFVCSRSQTFLTKTADGENLSAPIHQQRALSNEINASARSWIYLCPQGVVLGSKHISRHICQTNQTDSIKEMKESPVVFQPWKLKIISSMNNQNALTAQESSSLSRSIQGRTEVEVEAEQDAAELSAPCCLSPVTFFSSCSAVFVSIFFFSLSVHRWKRKKGNWRTNRLFPRNFPENGEKSVPSFAFSPSSRSRTVTGIEAGLLLWVLRFLRHRKDNPKIQ